MDILKFKIPCLLFYFTAYSFLGWCVETVYVSLYEQRLIIRGFLYGPFCPIYGFGALIFILFLKPLTDSRASVFFGGVILTTLLEYITSLGLEAVFGMRLWDYSMQPINVQGRVCFLFSLLWGFGAIIILELIQPAVERLTMQIPISIRILVSYFLILYFLIDFSIITVLLNTSDYNFVISSFY